MKISMNSLVFAEGEAAAGSEAEAQRHLELAQSAAEAAVAKLFPN